MNNTIDAQADDDTENLDLFSLDKTSIYVQVIFNYILIGLDKILDFTI
jgi:hypothetical protein